MMSILNGTLLTVKITIFAMIAGVLLGMIIALGRISKNKILNAISWFYVWVFRGTPLLLQLFVVYYALPLLTLDLFGSPIKLPGLTAAYLAFTINTAAYLAEVFRAGIQSIDKGQLEAGKALGMSYNQTMFKIIIPQSIRRLIPPMGNELIMLIKDTSLVASIAMFDLLRSVNQMANATGKTHYFLYAAGIYLFFTTIIQYAFGKIEKKYAAYE
ncbi:ABC transporter permease subunit [Alkalibaculum sp. M08DMB]|uniref:ABC transporter permease subunit n=2 Tax=Alkalibaculum sporogenes TaxID=2655001 RepID=A0A6A7K9G1_9FIRM|nr:ABC transporter permease subunit [Alkalibaculum sporogenes]